MIGKKLRSPPQKKGYMECLERVYNEIIKNCHHRDVPTNIVEQDNSIISEKKKLVKECDDFFVNVGQEFGNRH